MQSSTSVAQSTPVYPSSQVHVYELTASEHAPFTHGDDSHSLCSGINKHIFHFRWRKYLFKNRVLVKMLLCFCICTYVNGYGFSYKFSNFYLSDIDIESARNSYSRPSRRPLDVRIQTHWVLHPASATSSWQCRPASPMTHDTTHSRQSSQPGTCTAWRRDTVQCSNRFRRMFCKATCYAVARRSYKNLFKTSRTKRYFIL